MSGKNTPNMRPEEDETELSSSEENIASRESSSQAEPEAESPSKAKGKKGLGQVEKLHAKVSELEEQTAQMTESLLRAKAEFENSKKRIAREKEESLKFANESLIRELVPVLNEFDRAISDSEAARDFDALHKGIELVSAKLYKLLSYNWDLHRIECKPGDVFDPALHEALFQEKKSDVDEPEIAEVYQSGYKLGERVLSATKVKVFTPEEK